MGNQQQGKVSRLNSQATFRLAGEFKGMLDTASGSYPLDLSPDRRIVFIGAVSKEDRRFFQNQKVGKDMLKVIKESWPNVEELQVY